MTTNRLLLNNSEEDEELFSDYEIVNQERIFRNRRKLTLSKNIFYRCTRKLSKYFLALFATIILLLIVSFQIYNRSNLRTRPLPGWEFNISRNISNYILPNIETTIIEPRSLCLHNFFVLIVVFSSVDTFGDRQAIRETWGNVTEFNYPMFEKMHSHMKGHFLSTKQERVKSFAEYINLHNETNYNINISSQNIPVRIVFLIGKELRPSNQSLARIKLESEQYDDLIQEDFIDTYNNLTIKSVMLLKWIQSKCANRMKFVLKCDDDTFVNIPNLIHYLLGGTIPVYNDSLEFYDTHTVNALSPANRLLLSDNLLTGYLFCYINPVSSEKSKWYVPYYMFSEHIYPPYISGSSYLMSYDVVGKLYNSVLNTSILHLEDVYLTGICAKKINLHRRHNPLFLFNDHKKLCSFKGVITQHYLSQEKMYSVYNFVVNTTKHCAPPEKYYGKRRLSSRPQCKT